MGQARVIGMVLIALGAVPMVFGLGVWLIQFYLYFGYFSGCGISGLCSAPPDPVFLFVGLFGGVLVDTGIAMILRESRMAPATPR